MKANARLLLTACILGYSGLTSAQTLSTDRDTARKHAGCANAYSAYLDRTRGNKDQSPRATAETFRSLHQRVTIALAGEEDAQRLLRATKVSLQLALTAIEQTKGSDPQAVENFFNRRIETCTQHLNDLTDEQRVYVEKLPK